MHYLIPYLISVFTSIAYALPTLKVRNDLGNVSSRQLSNGQKYVVCHHMVGNTYPYAIGDWSNDISLAQSSGIDAFALNIGSDSWQQNKVADAYAAAKAAGNGFKLFISFDMSILPCGDPGAAQLLRTYIATYAQHPSQFIYQGRMFVSTFAGETCTFGHPTADQGWSQEITQHPDVLSATSGAGIFFMPSFFIAPNAFSNFADVMSGYFSWNSGWPITVTTDFARSFLNDPLNGNAESTSPSLLDLLAMFIGATDQDDQYRQGLSGGKAYMAAVSPWFFTHYGSGSYNKNFIYLADQHIYHKRWEKLIATRNEVDIVEIISWNDYGESHYIGPIEGAQPNSQQWVDGMDHEGWLRMTSYYAQAFKTGSSPQIGNDELYMWARPHPAFAPSNDPVGKPTNFELVEDKLWAVVMVPTTATVTLTFAPNSGVPTSQTFSVDGGVTPLSMLLPENQSGVISGSIERNGQTTVQMGGQAQGGAFSWNVTPPSENFNAWVASATSG